jgi:CBS-domain-containing membrane protein
MNDSFWNTLAKEIMTKVVVTINANEKIETAAELMACHSINALPVLLKSGSCIGVLTSQNVAEYEAIRKSHESQWKHGYFFDLARYGVEDAQQIAKLRYDEVDYHMSRQFVVGRPDESLYDLSVMMCNKHCHHAVILDNEAQGRGIISSLDILRRGVSVGCTED